MDEAGQASIFSLPPNPTPQKMLRGTQTGVTSASVTATPSLIPTIAIKEFKYELPKQEEFNCVDDFEYDDEVNFVGDETRAYGRENVGPLASSYLLPYVYKRRFLDTQYGIRMDADMFMIGDSPLVVDTSGDITIKERVFKGSKGLRELLTRK